MPNWKTLVEKQNAETFVLPDGWDSREDIAEQLECSPDRVDDSLRPGLKSGRFIKQSFKVWNATLKRNVMVIAYHDTAEDGVDDVSVERIKALKAEGKTYAEIGKTMGKSGDMVRGILRRAS